MASAMVRKTPADLLKMAISEHQKNHNLNAFVLGAAAMQLSARGPFLQLGIQQEIQQSLAGVQAPHELEGSPPFNFQFGKSLYKVLNIGPIGVAGRIYLQIDHEIESWRVDKEADAKNREFLSAFDKAYPECRTVFAGIVIRAHERGGTRGFGTVSENDGLAK
jgi:hypothetical protein